MIRPITHSGYVHLPRFAIRRVMLLEFSQYLENYLWPNFTPDKVSFQPSSTLFQFSSVFQELLNFDDKDVPHTPEPVF